MASAGARAYNGGLGAEPPAGAQGAEPPVGVRGQRPPEADEVFVFKTVIFNASATVLQEMMHCLSCFFCAQIYGFTVRICSLAIAGQHLSIIRQVHGSCLGLTGRLREKPDIPIPSPSLYLPPVPSSPLLPLEVDP